MTEVPGDACFELSFLGPIQFFTGPPLGPAGCLVSGNVEGCPFNPTIYAIDQLPGGFPVPALRILGLAVLVALLGALPMRIMRRSH